MDKDRRRTRQDEYKKIVTQDNKALEELRKQGKLPTPEQIVEATKKNKDYDLLLLIKEYERSKEEEMVSSEISNLTPLQQREKELSDLEKEEKELIKTEELIDKYTAKEKK